MANKCSSGTSCSLSTKFREQLKIEVWVHLGFSSGEFGTSVGQSSQLRVVDAQGKLGSWPRQVTLGGKQAECVFLPA